MREQTKRKEKIKEENCIFWLFFGRLRLLFAMEHCSQQCTNILSMSSVNAHTHTDARAHVAHRLMLKDTLTSLTLTLAVSIYLFSLRCVSLISVHIARLLRSPIHTHTFESPNNGLTTEIRECYGSSVVVLVYGIDEAKYVCSNPGVFDEYRTTCAEQQCAALFAYICVLHALHKAFYGNLNCLK